jgi:DNA-binding transcriptional LysR family regulator
LESAVITLRQIEALRWIADLGTFERAANRLNITQSAISKRIQELEATVGFEIFDRSHRMARSTEKGEILLSLGRELLNVYDRILSLRAGDDVVSGRLRIGLTELSTITWFPRFVAQFQQSVPGVSVEPHVDTSSSLYERLLEEEFDIIVTPKCFTDPAMTIVPVGEAANVWLARPGLVPDGKSLTLVELSSYTVVMQGRRSGSGVIMSRWLKDEGADFPSIIVGDNLNVLFGLTVAGAGIGCLPLAFAKAAIEQEKLREITVDPPLPPVSYVAMHKSDRMSFIVKAAMQIIQETCCLTRPI